MSVPRLLPGGGPRRALRGPSRLQAASKALATASQHGGEGGILGQEDDDGRGAQPMEEEEDGPGQENDAAAANMVVLPRPVAADGGNGVKTWRVPEGLCEEREEADAATVEGAAAAAEEAPKVATRRSNRRGTRGETAAGKEAVKKVATRAASEVAVERRSTRAGKRRAG